MYKEEIVSLASHWTLEQLNKYIGELETRVSDTHALIIELKRIRKRKTSKHTPENGPRGGM